MSSSSASLASSDTKDLKDLQVLKGLKESTDSKELQTFLSIVNQAPSVTEAKELIDRLKLAQLLVVHSIKKGKCCHDGAAFRLLFQTFINKDVECEEYVHGVENQPIDINRLKGKHVVYGDCCCADIRGFNEKEGKVTILLPILKSAVLASASFTIIDHHPTTNDQLAENGWSDEKSRPKHMKVYLDQTTKRCASRMLYSYLVANKSIPLTWDPYMIHVVSLQDVGERDLMTEEDRQYYLALIRGDTYESFSNQHKLGKTALIQQGLPLYAAHKSMVEERTKESNLIFGHTFFGHKCVYVPLSVSGKEFGVLSDLKQALWKYTDTLVYITRCYDMSKNQEPTTSFSLRVRPGSNIDLSVLARSVSQVGGFKASGGGHAAASAVKVLGEVDFLGPEAKPVPGIVLKEMNALVKN
jgi:oligoribonuclease NrnB/cAMP/cGMP phosphodiesterase (DHH superfamily)